MEKLEPTRMCCVCRQRFAKSQLSRFVLQDGKPEEDRLKQMPGRGYYLCPNPACVGRFPQLKFKRNAHKDELHG